MEASIPKNVGRYVVDRLLGSGAMGYVFLGRDPELDRPVAIKTLRDMGLDSSALERFLERFRNEARAAARLQHPAIVQVYDVGQDEQAGPYLVFEYVAGSTLKQILRDRGPLAPERVVQLAEQVADALDTAHQRDIIHRDLKPENLLVTPEGLTKLADFGVARVPNAALTREGQFLGTPCYAAPETLSEGQYGPKTDVFSFAAVLYEAISGARAFPGEDAVGVASRVLHDDPPPPSRQARGTQVPREVDDELMRGLSKDPGKRHESATALATALHDAYERAGALSPDQARARPDSRRFRTSGPPGPREGSRHTGLAFGAVLAGALAVGIGLVVAFNQAGFDPLGSGTAAAGPGVEGDATSPSPPAAKAAESERDSGLAAASATDAGSADAEPQGAVVLRSGGQRAADGGTQAVEQMTPHEREEAAKDALFRVREQFERKNWPAVRDALEEARNYDPENPDIRVYRRKLKRRTGRDPLESKD